MELKYNVDEMTWTQFMDEFNDQFFNANIMRAHQDQLDNLQQGDMMVIEVVTKFKTRLRLCLGAATTDQAKVRRVIRAFRSNIAVHVDHGIYPLANIEKCYHAAL